MDFDLLFDILCNIPMGLLFTFLIYYLTNKFTKTKVDGAILFSCYLSGALLWFGIVSIENWFGISFEETLVVDIAQTILILFIPLLYFSSKDQLGGFISGTLYGAAVGIGVGTGFELWYSILEAVSWAEEVDAGLIEEAYTIAEELLYYMSIYWSIFFDLLYFGVMGAFLGYTVEVIKQQTLERRLISIMTGFIFVFLWQIHAETLIEALIENESDWLVVMVLMVSSIGGIGICIAMISITQAELEKKRARGLLELVIPIGGKLSRSSDFAQLLEDMLEEALSFCKANAGTIILKTATDQLKFVIVRHNPRRIERGGSTDPAVVTPPINETELEADSAIAKVLESKNTVNIWRPNNEAVTPHLAHKDFGYIFPWKSALLIPLINPQGALIGIMELFDAHNPTHEIIPFDANLQELLESYATLSTAALESYRQNVIQVAPTQSN